MRQMNECKWYQLCPMKRFHEKGMLPDTWLDDYCRNGGSGCVRYKMEERGEPHPDWMLPDGTLDEQLKNS